MLQRPITPTRLHPIEPLQQPRNHIPGLRQRELLPNAYPRAPVERQVLPPGDALAPLPPLRPERVRIRPPQVRPPLHRVHAVLDLGGAARVERDDGAEAQRLGEGVLERRAGLEARVGDGGGGGPEGGEDGGAEGGVGVGVAREQQEEPGEERGGGVAAGEEDVEELGAQLGGVGGVGCEGAEEDVAFFLRVLLVVGVGVGRLLQRHLHEVVDEGVHRVALLLEARRVA